MHSVIELQEKLRRRYHQPKGVEQFGIEPVPDELKTVRWFDIFSIIFGFALNPGSMLVGGLAVVSGLSFLGAVGAITSGVLPATIAYTIMATVGVDFGLPGQVSTRMAYGVRGAKWVPSLLRTIASTYWFAYQTVAGSLAVVAILDRWTGTPHSLIMVSVVFAVLQAVVAIIGFASLKHLSRMALPFKIVILSMILVFLGTHDDPHFAPSAVLHYAGKPAAGWLLFVTWMNVVAAGSLTMVTDSADFCRYTRSRADMWLGTLLGKVGGGCFAALLGAYGASATLGKTANVVRRRLGAQCRPFHIAAVSNRDCARQLDDQCPQPLHGRVVVIEYFRATGTLLDNRNHQRTGHRTVGSAERRDWLHDLCRHVGQCLLAHRRGANCRLYFRQAHENRPRGAV
jgi:purine-cytosine permease-like protein